MNTVGTLKSKTRSAYTERKGVGGEGGGTAKDPSILVDAVTDPGDRGREGGGYYMTDSDQPKPTDLRMQMTSRTLTNKRSRTQSPGPSSPLIPHSPGNPFICFNETPH